jgi:serine/threonine protein kinase
MESLIGQTVLHYAILEKLGAGGMGEIYKARDSRLNRVVAVKVLAPGKMRDPMGRRRFIQEAQAASALNHPNIITIHDILPDGDTQYMVMEFVAGKTLHELIAAGRLSVPQVLQLSTQMANALGVAHAAGIIHRDFKPANVMVTGTGLVKILDFGLAKLTDVSAHMEMTSDGYPNTLTAAPLTREGSIMGTVNYMSPEQAEGLKVDGRSDIFSFGAVLYEMVTGHRAFDGDSGISTLSAVLRDEVKPIHQMAPDVPPELANIVNRCLRKNAAARWQSMTEVEVELNNLKRRSDSGVLHAPAVGGLPESSPLLSNVPASSVPASSLPASSVTPAVSTRRSGIPKAILLGAACLAVLAIAAVGAWWPMHKRQTAAIVAATAPVSPAPTTASPTPEPVVPPPAAALPTPEPVVPPPAVPAPAAPATVAKPGSTPKHETAPATRTAESLPKNTATAPAPKSVSPYAPQAPVIAAAPPVSTPVAPPPAPREVAPPVTRSAPAELVPVKLNDGLPFRIELLEDVPTDAEVGRELRFRVLDGVQSGDTTVIAKGSYVTGALADLGGKRNFFGQSSKVRFRLIAAQSVDDTKISVRATRAARSDGERRPFATPNGTKNKDLIAASGTEYIAYISGDQTVHVHK